MRAFLLAMLVISTLTPTTADAYVVLYTNGGEPRIWDDLPITWRFAASGSNDVPKSQAVASIQAAFDSWENISCSTLDFTYGGETTSYPNNGIYVEFEEVNWDVTVADAAGVTTNWQFGSFGGGVTKVDIYFNAVDFTWATTGADEPGSDVSDIQSVMAHEIGHAIGLDHSRDRDATMWFTTYPGQAEDQQNLSDDDIRAACFLYPAVSFNDGQVCDACSEGSHCVDGLCLNYGAEGAFCGQDCSATQGCPEGFSCFQLQGIDTPQCLPDNDHCAPVGGNIQVGDFCYDHSTCQSGQCLVLPDSAVCTQSCNPLSTTGCPSGMECLGQGTDGICYPQGDGQLGDLCVTAADCVTFECVGLGDGQGICTQSCSSDAQCGAGALCTFDFCIPIGASGFGAPCTLPTDCEGTICNFGKCTQECTSDDDCPGDGTCPSGICTIGAQGQLGDTCGQGAETCVSGLTCLVTEQGSTLGTCQEQCDVRTDVCSDGRLCKWFYASWSNKVTGYCVSPEGGAALGEACGGAVTCEVGLVCADTETTPTCLQDCNGGNLLGCPSGTKCKSLEWEDNPKLGACFPLDGGGPVTPPDAGGTTGGMPDAGSSDGADGIDGVDGADGTTGTSAGAGSDGLDGSDTGDGLDGTTAPAADASASGDVGRRGGSSGGCTQAPSAPSSSTAQLLLLLGILVLWARSARVARVESRGAKFDV